MLVSTSKILNGHTPLSSNIVLRHLTVAQPRGALPGGFTQEALSEWAANFWNPDDVKYVDLYSHKISKPCASWLKTHPYPSSELARAFLGSKSFLPERLLLTPFSYPNISLPDGQIPIGHEFLLWTVVVNSPHEMILEWSILGKVHGCTMVAVDPGLCKVYHGNCLKFQVGYQAITLHAWYAQRLLLGMVHNLEQRMTTN